MSAGENAPQAGAGAWVNLPKAPKTGIIGGMTNNLPTTTTLLIIRHGETAANVAGAFQGIGDDPLNDRGQAQAEALARRLATDVYRLAAVVSSPLRRAQQTAQRIAVASGNPSVQVDTDLAEYHLGEWDGLTYQQLRHEKRLWERMAADPNFAPPGGESAVQFATRVVRSLRRIAAGHAGQTVAVVSHGGAMATALAMFLTGDGKRWTEYQMDNCALTELVLNPAPVLGRFNDTSHLKTSEAVQASDV